MPSLPSATRGLLSQERMLPPADPMLRRRVLKRARAVIEERPSGVGLRVESTHSPARSSSRWARSLLLVAATLAMAGLAGAGVRLYGLDERALDQPAPVNQTPAHPTPPAPRSAVAEGVRPAGDSPEPAPLAVDPVELRRPAAEPTRIVGASTYALELQLLEPARDRIAQGDFTAALVAITRHQREYPRGQLAEEREALRVRALWGMGARAEAESAAATFRKRYPHSGLLGWMKTALR